MKRNVPLSWVRVSGKQSLGWRRYTCKKFVGESPQHQHLWCKGSNTGQREKLNWIQPFQSPQLVTQWDFEEQHDLGKGGSLYLKTIPGERFAENSATNTASSWKGS